MLCTTYPKKNNIQVMFVFIVYSKIYCMASKFQDDREAEQRNIEFETTTATKK